MATWTTSRATSGDQARYSHVGPVVEAFTYAMSATNSATDAIQLFKVLPGARVVRLNVWTDTATLTYSIGDGGATGRYMTTASAVLTGWTTGSTVSTVVRNINVGAGLCYSYSAADTVDIRFDAAGGGATTTIYVVGEVVYDQQETI